MGEGSHIYGNRGRSGSGNKRTQRSINSAGASRLAAKSNINGAYSRNQVVTLTREESSIRNRPYENGRSIDSNGRVVYSSAGSKHGVRIGNRTNNVTTHNHPNDQFKNPNSIAGKIGQSFSGTDIANAITANSAGTRVTTPGYTFNIDRPKSGWPKVRASAVKSTYTKELRKFLNQNMGYAASGPDQHDRAWAMANHKAAQAVAKKYGLNYTRKKN